MSEHYDYVAWRDGLIVGLVVDDPRYSDDTARSIAEWVRRGCTIERMSHEELRDIPRDKFFRSAKKESQPSLFQEGR